MTIMNNLQARIAGGLFGCAVGDALGASFEGSGWDEKREIRMSGGGQFNLKIGEGTDDTLMMLALAETYCETGYFDRTVFLQKVILTLREDDTTFGRTTKTVTSLLEQGCSPEADVSALHAVCGSRTNGSAMRTIPVGLVMTNDVEDTARKVSAYTHYDITAGDCCAVISKAAAGLTAGKSKAEIFSEIAATYLSGELIPSIDPIETTRCALACFRNGCGYTDVIHRACVLGGDTDTIACIAGGLAGIYYGVPKNLTDALLLKERISTVALKLTERVEEQC